MATTATHDDEDASKATTTQQEAAAFNGPGRMPAVRVMLPGREDPSNRLTNPLPLDKVLKDTTEQSTQIDYLEILGMPGHNQDDQHDQYEHFLIGRNTSESSTEAKRQAANPDDSTQQTLDEHQDEPPDTEDSNDDQVTAAVGTVTNALEEHCPEVDYQIGQLGLGSFSDIPVPTSRLLVFKDQTLDAADGAMDGGAIELINTLNQNRIPHIYQLLIKRASASADSDYVATVRVAVFDEEYGIATDNDLAEHHSPTSTYAYCISQYFRDEVTTSNFNLPTEQLEALLNSGTSKRYRVNGQPKYLRNNPYPIEELTTFREYKNLLAGSFNADPRYKRHFDHFAHMPVNGNAVPRLAMIFPAYFEHSPWDRTAITDGPVFRTDNIPTSATTTHRYGTDSARTTPGARDPDQSTSEAHKALVNFIVNYLVQQGYTILAVDQQHLDADLTDPDPTTQSYFPGDSQPDIVARKDGDITVFEAEINDTNPAAYLKNLERATHFDYTVVVVTEDQSDLENKCKQASRPFNRDAPVTRDGRRLYNFSTHGIEADDTTFLLPAGTTETKWYLSHDDELTLHTTTDSQNPSGHVEDPLHTFTYNAPRYQQEGDEYIVRSAAGEHLGTYPTETALRNDFTKIKRPFIPTQLTYCKHLELRYKDSSTNQLKRYYNQPPWARKYRNKPGKRHKKSRNDFLTTHTTEATDESLFIPTVRAQYYPWFDHQTTLDAPTEDWFTRGIDEQFNVTDTDSRDRELLDRTWIYTPNLEPNYTLFPDP